MTIPDGYRLVSPARDRAQDLLHVAGFAFAFTVPAKDAQFIDRIIPFDRARAVEVTDSARGPAGSLAAVHASFPFTTCVPGGRTVPTAGLTWVAVHQGHRRRGLLRAMMTDHFSRSLARGEVISTLYAAETPIYQRFGYGLAAPALRMELSRGAQLRDVPGSDALTVTLDSADAERDAEVVRTVQSRMTRPGTTTTLTDEYVADLFLDLEHEREGAEELRILTIRDGDAPVAYALFQRKESWNDAGADGKVRVRCWAALDAAASHRLWSVLVDFDLMSATQADKFAHDDPLVHLLKEPRGAKMGSYDNLWLRILDVKGALEGRGWSTDCDVTVAVEDSVLPDNAGTWRIRAVDGAATVDRSDDDPEVTVGIQDLGATYLGGPTLAALAAAGLVTEHRVGAVQALSRALSSDVKPVANLNF
ncbi:GNAT family N-acetyltransferase [Demequina activiva]|uniref:UPF0256 protein n=1 Tax=Demequina activiva TaxID=1582364 RepID=A0A919Q0F0_9MICO|nr:GNAT family N-acetyltransferase [Demequina activiva]GIG53399.1 UPF0256 protein [Demequina activiva]